MTARGTTILSGSSTVPPTVPLLMDWEKRGALRSIANASRHGPKSQFRKGILASYVVVFMHALTQGYIQEKAVLLLSRCAVARGYDPWAWVIWQQAARPRRWAGREPA